MRFNKEQKQAIAHREGPLLINAGPGSGKTAVVTKRIADLISEGISPDEVLAITFTVKAAGEMRDRVVKQVGSEGNRVMVKTFHSFAYYLLGKLESKYLGYTLLEGSQQLRIVQRYLDDEFEGLKGVNKGIAGVLTYKNFNPYTILTCVDTIKNNNVVILDSNKDDVKLIIKGYVDYLYKDGQPFIAAGTYRQYKEVFNNYYKVSNLRELEEELLLRLVYKYEWHKGNQRQLDYGDLLVLTNYELSRDVNSCKKEDLLGRYMYISVDEYQDTNKAQYELIKHLSDFCRNILVVGDPDQAIYTWRGADISIIMDFQKDFKGAKVITLGKNYRSSKSIVGLANTFIKKNTLRLDKELTSHSKDETEIDVYGFSNETEQANFIISDIERNGLNLSETVVLYRAGYIKNKLTTQLQAKGIPYKVVGEIDYFDRILVKGAINYLKYVSNPYNDDIIYDLLLDNPTQLKGFGSKKLGILKRSHDELGMSLMEYVETGMLDIQSELLGLSTNHTSELKGFIEFIKGLEDLDDTIDTVDKLLSSSRYKKLMRDKDKDERGYIKDCEVIDQFKELFTTIKVEWDIQGDKNLGIDFTINYVLGKLEDFRDKVDDEDSDVLTLMTMHGAKGLEFDNVYIIGLEDSVFPSFRAVSIESKEEERRLAFVAMTRARKKLVLSHVSSRYNRDCSKSIYIKEVQGIIGSGSNKDVSGNCDLMDELETEDRLDEFELDGYDIIEMEHKKGRYMVVETIFFECCDDANGYGYKTKESAYKGFSWKLKNGYVSNTKKKKRKTKKNKSKK